MTRPTWTEPTLFDDVCGVPVPTLHRDGAEQRDALAAEQEPRTEAERQARHASATDLEAFALGATTDRTLLEAARDELQRRGVDVGPVRLLLHTPASIERAASTLWTCSR